MKVKVESKDQTIKVSDMADGDIGVIVDEHRGRHGVVVQMVKTGYSVTENLLLRIGGTVGESWSGQPDFNIRLLKKGEKIEVVG